MKAQEILRRGLEECEDFLEGGNRHTVPPEEREPRWPALMALLAVGGLYSALPPSLTVGPRWLLFVVVSILSIPTMITHHYAQHQLNQLLGYAVTIVVTMALIGSVTLLVLALPHEDERDALVLLRSAGALWLTNVLVFALWYWRLDAGGPNQRDLKTGHQGGAFLFPQMTMDPEQLGQSHERNWSPQFADYLFLAFNTSTALSPADTAPLSRWAKLLMMLQSLVSLTIIVLLAARAVNVL